MTSNNSSRRDPNSVVVVGTPVNGRISKKLNDFVVVEFGVGAVKCSGVLHVSEFPSLVRAERDAMFGVAEVGMPANGIVVLSTTPPEGEHRFTKVRLSALKPLKDALPPKPEAQPKRDNKPRVKKNEGDRTGNEPAAQPDVGDKPKADKKPAQKQKKAKKAAPAPVVTAPADPIAAARALVASVKQPTDSVASLADLSTAMSLKTASADVGFMARIRAIEEGLGVVERCAAEGKEIVRGHSDVVVAAALKVNAARKEGARLDAEAATLKQMGARYAGLCGKVKKDPTNEALTTEQTKAKSAIDSRREQLGKDREANKSAYNDAEFELIMASGCGGTGAEDFEALAAIGAQLDKLQTEGAEKTAWLGKMVMRSNRHLEPKKS